MDITIIDPFVGNTWDSLVKNYSEHNIFHRSSWARVLTESYQHRPYYIKISHNNVALSLIPIMEVNSIFTGKRGVSVPFADETSPLCNGKQFQQKTLNLLEKFSEERKWQYLELRGGANSQLNINRYYQTHEIILSHGIERIQNLLYESTRRAIRKAQRSQLTVCFERDENSLKKFYELHCITRCRHGVPPQPWYFFRSIGRNIIEPGNGMTVLAYYRNKPVAGAVFLFSCKKALFKFGASDKSFWEYRPNHLVMWNALKKLCEEKFEILHLGRSCPENSGLIRFKKSWGCSEKRIFYYKIYPTTKKNKSAKDVSLKTVGSVYKYIPKFFNNIVGNIIYPHID